VEGAHQGGEARARQRHELLAGVADAEPAVLVQPGDRSFDDPAFFAEPGAVVALGPGNLGADSARLQLKAFLTRV
jgi:hypothetical protein